MNNLSILFDNLSFGTILTTGALVALAVALPIALQIRSSKHDRLALGFATAALLLMAAAMLIYVVRAAPEFTSHSLIASIFGTAAYFFCMCSVATLFSNKFPSRLASTCAIICLAGYFIWHEGSAITYWKHFCQLLLGVGAAIIVITYNEHFAPKMKRLCLLVCLFVAVSALPGIAPLILSLLTNAPDTGHFESSGAKVSGLLWLVTPILGYAALVGLIQARLSSRLRESIDFDMLTGARSRRYLFEAGEQIIEKRKQSSEFGTVALLIDLDHFKEVNDSWGHAVGDRVLSHTVKCIKETIRESDTFVARYGGEEFCVILGKSDSERGDEVAERLRKAIAETPYYYDGNAIHVTISIGQAKASAEHSLSSLIRLADQRLYIAKQSGRNQVVVA
jgi:diguanylate cyclase (GGDEF)-like protein